MQQFLNLVLSGLVTGAIYSIMASGIILTYTTSGIFNFAHGAIAFVSAYFYYQLHTGSGVPIVPAAVVTVLLFAPLLGLLLDRILLRRLARAPVHARVVGTIGLLVALPNLAQWLVVTVGIGVFDLDGLVGHDAVNSGTPVAGLGPSPPRFFHPLAGVVLNTDQLAVFLVAAVSAVALWYVIRRTRLGLEMRAVVDREPLAAQRGVNAARTSAAAWVLTMVLAGLGGVLIAPLFTLTDSTFTMVVLGSLAVVVLGGLRSIPIAFVGGLGLGAVQNLVAGYSDSFLPEWLGTLSGLKSAVPFVLVLVILLGFGHDRSRRAGTISEERPRPDHRQGISPLRRRLPWAVWTLVLLAYSMQWFNVSWFHADTYAQTVIAQGLALSVILLSFVVVTGLGGMVSLAQATFVTVGGFATGWALSRDWGFDIPGVAHNGRLNFLWATVLGATAAAVVGMVIALPITRLGGVNLALGTLAFAFVCALVIFPIPSIGHGVSGWSIRQPTIDLPIVNQLNDLIVVGKQDQFDASLLPEQILLFLAVFGVLAAVIHALQRSASGRAILAVRSSEVAAEASGVRANRTKIMLFAFSAGIAGIGGAMLGLFTFNIATGTAPPLAGLFWLTTVVTFGVRRPGGALLAGLATSGGAAVLNVLADRLPGGAVNDAVTSPYFVPMLAGLGAIQLAQEPDGILSLVGQKQIAKRRAKERIAHIASAEAAAHGGRVLAREIVIAGPISKSAAAENGKVEPATLRLEGIVAGYDDVEVLHGLDLRVEAGQVVALLGANGAGKSTLCAVAAGTIDATFGTVTLRGADVTTAPVYKRARDGVVLVPEGRGIFPGLTVEENLEVSLPDPKLRAQALERFPALANRRTQVAGLLSGGEQQMLSLAPALIVPPALLIADEPTLGLAPLVAQEVVEAIGELRDLGTAVLLVEENAHNAMKVADTVAFMRLGSIVWTGPVASVDLDLLASSYFGSTPSAARNADGEQTASSALSV